VRHFTLLLTPLLLSLAACEESSPEPVYPPVDLSRSWSLKDYQAGHPKDAARAEALAKRVRAPAEPLASPPARALRVAVVYPGEQASDYWRRSVASFEARMRELTLPFTLKQYFTAPTVEVEKQAQQVHEALKDDPDYLVFTLDVSRHRQLIETLLTRQRPKLILQNVTTPVRAWGRRQPFLYVGFDHQVGTRRLAAEFLKRSKGPGECAVLYAGRGLVSQQRGQTFVEQVAGTSLKVVASYYTNTSRERARLATLDALKRHPNLNCVYACSTDIALGAVDALAAAGKLEQVLVNGWGGGAEELEQLAKGRLDLTVMRINDDNGVAMAEAIGLDQAGRGAEVPTVFSGEFQLVGKETSSVRVASLRALAFRYSDRAP